MSKPVTYNAKTLWAIIGVASAVALGIYAIHFLTIDPDAGVNLAGRDIDSVWK